MTDTYPYALVDGPNLTGIYRVDTEHSNYWFDFDNRTLVRNPCEPDSSDLTGDFEHLELGTLSGCRLGSPLELTYINARGDYVVRTSTKVTLIELIEDAA